jgi:hypothetical protein
MIASPSPVYDTAGIAEAIARSLAGEGNDSSAIEYFVRSGLHIQRQVITQLAAMSTPPDFDTICEAYATFERTRPKTLEQKSTPSVHLYWWGYEVIFPIRLVLRLDTFDPRLEAVQTALQNVATGKRLIFPYIEALARMFAEDYQLLKYLARSNQLTEGIIISASWVAPTVFIPAAFLAEPPDEARETTTTN